MSLLVFFICSILQETSALGTTMTLGSLLPQQTLAKENLISNVLQYLNEEVSVQRVNYKI